MRRVVGYHVILVIVLAGWFGPLAHASNPDSLFRIWNSSSKHDTIRLNALYDMAREGFLFSQPDSCRSLALMGLNMSVRKRMPRYEGRFLSSIGSSYLLQGDLASSLECYDRSLELFERLADDKGSATVLGNMGLVYYYLGDYTRSLVHHVRALKLHEKNKNKKGMADALGNIGLVHYDKDDYPLSLDFQLRALRLYEELDDTRGIANTVGNIGLVYRSQGELRMALKYHFKACSAYEKLGDKIGIANSLGNLGSIYQALEQYDSSLIFHQKSLAMERDLENEIGIATSLINIGTILHLTGDMDGSLSILNEALEISRRLGDQHGMASALGNIGLAHLGKQEFQEALEVCDRSFELAEQIDKDDLRKDACECRAQAYEGLGEHRAALEQYRMFMDYRDKVYKQENTAEIARRVEHYRSEKVQLQDSLRHEKKLHSQKVQAAAEVMAEKKMKTIIAWAGSGGIILLAILALVLFNGNREKQRANLLITSQKNEVERQKEVVVQKNREIMDSIVYAKRLQEVILPPARLVKEYLGDSFILYKPRDVVAGDFYWMEAKDGVVWYAAADCTGHGVPGAMVSVVCANALNRSFHEFGLRDPGEILDKVRELVVKTYSNSEEQVRDGMDIALVRHDIANKNISYAGANRPLWVIRQGVETMLELSLEEVLITSRTMSLAGCTLAEVRPNRQPIGLYELSDNFDTHHLSLRDGDTIYLFSDGFADQFGGATENNPGGKKFKYGSLKRLLCSINQEDMIDQKHILRKVFEDWKGDLEQVDDVCVLGVRI